MAGAVIAGAEPKGKIGFHAGKVAVERPRVRDLEGHELALPSWERAGRGGLARQVGDEPDADQRIDAEIPPSGAVSRGRCSRASGGRAALRGVVGCAHEGMDGCGSVRPRHHGGQIDGVHISEHLVLVAALEIDSEGFKHPLGLMEGATEHSAVVQALIDDLSGASIQRCRVCLSSTARRRSRATCRSQS
jgi:putative transposase